MMIRIRGLVQGVGFRPTVWRLARQHGLRGHVLNDGQGVRIYAVGRPDTIRRFLDNLRAQPPTLARIDDLFCEPASAQEIPRDFTILASGTGSVMTGVLPDAATCADCLAEVRDPFARRYRYPLTNCTHCGPRLTIQEHIPYDRSGTTMSRFSLCPVCATEYRTPSDRRFHAQPIACHECGPKVWLERADGKRTPIEALTALDALDAASTLLQQGRIVAIKGLGGVQLACDATQEATVARLRRKKARDGKPFALMARDLRIIRDYCEISEQEQSILESPAAPIVIMERRLNTGLEPELPPTIAPSVAPGLRTLGFMLPSTALHHLLLQRMDRPIVLTSGNRSDEPQWIDNDQAKEQLAEMTDSFLLHDRPIAHRVDDSVTKVIGGAARIFRRSRGYAPAPIALPSGFAQAPPVLAMGGELKNTFCLFQDGRAILSHHIGDLADALTLADYRRAMDQYRHLFAHAPAVLAIDRHPEYLSSKIGRGLAATETIPLREVQHHHAHIAACLAEHGLALDHPPVLGIALDGLGHGDDGTLWGGEFLLAGYRTARRIGTFKPVALLGGEQAIKEPWRNTYAHLMAGLGWARFAKNYSGLDLYRYLADKPRALLDGMLGRGINSPPASSCGRLFDAVAAAMGICRDRASYEGQAAVELEQQVDRAALEEEDEARVYLFAMSCLKETKLPYLDPSAMWEALLDDLLLKTPIPIMAARFHKGLARAICAMADQTTRSEGGERAVRQVALSGGVFQNQVLFELVASGLEALGFQVLSHRQVPCNDGGLALGQAVIAAAQELSGRQ
jgi:hydrogenase maturation protein HypF